MENNNSKKYSPTENNAPENSGNYSSKSKETDTQSDSGTFNAINNLSIEHEFRGNDKELINPDDFNEGTYDGTDKREIRTPGL